MTKDDDLIRRGDATKIANHLGFLDNPDSVAYAVSEAISAIPAVQPTVTPDVVEIDIRAVMMEQIEEAATQSPWVPPEYAMNEVISDCCSFLREPRYPSPDVAALVEALEFADRSFDDDYSKNSTEGMVGRAARAALARVKGVM